MSRYTLQTVTLTLPVLVELGHEDSLKDAAGRANFLDGERGDLFVRVVRAVDVKAKLRTIFTPKEIPLYVGAVQLKQALDAGDEFAIQSASDKVRPWMSDFAEFTNLLLEIDTVKKRTSLKSRGSNILYSAFVNYGRLMADMFARARFVMWYSERDNRLLPALFCPDWKTAAFLLTFSGRIRVCPKCSEPFIPQADNKDYCEPAHGVAYRTARSRWRAEQRTEGRKRKGRKSKK